MFDQQTIEIPCSNCGKNTKKTVGWLKTNKSFVCHCGTTINLNASNLLRELKEAERSLNKLFK